MINDEKKIRHEALLDYDWEEAFEYAGNYQNVEPVLPLGDMDCSPFTRADVLEIHGMKEGVNNEEEWLIYGKLDDGRFFFLEAWCDYTGWDCQAGGKAVVAPTREMIERFGMGNNARRDLGIVLPEERMNRG